MADTISVKNAVGETVDVATNDAVITKIAELIAKVLAAPATEAKQDAIIAALGQTLQVDTDVSGLATQTTLAAVLAKLSSDPATETGLTAIANALAGTLSVSANALPLPTGAATATKQDTLTDAVNLVATRDYDDASGQHLVYDGAEQSEAITATEVTVVATTDCYIAFGTDPTAAADAGSMLLPAGAIWTRRITSGWKVSAIKVADAGALSIMPVS